MTDYNVLTVFEIDGENYIAILFEKQECAEAELQIFKYISVSDEEIELIEITDNRELGKAVEFLEGLSFEQ